MKTKDIIVIAFAIGLMGVSGFFIYKMLEEPKVTTTTSTVEQQTTLSQKDYDATLKLVTEKKDYGEATLDNIGRVNPFGALN